MQTGEPGKTVDYGVVSDGFGLEDSPDSERIAGGINTKGPDAVAIGRQANMLQWGFYAGPDKMTESARKVFLNAIVYMRRFDGRSPLVRKSGRSREWLRRYVDLLRKYRGNERYEGSAKYLEGRFPVAAKASKRSPDELAAWVDEHIDFIYAEGRGPYQVDADLLALKMPNNGPQLLSYLESELSKKRIDPRVYRLAKRYLPEPHARDATSIGAYIRGNREKLFFSDQGGYRWLVDTRKPRRRVY